MEPENEFLQLEDKVIKVLMTIYDPEIPLNIWDLGLVYEVDADDDDNVKDPNDTYSTQLSNGGRYTEGSQGEG